MCRQSHCASIRPCSRPSCGRLPVKPHPVRSPAVVLMRWKLCRRSPRLPILSPLRHRARPGQQYPRQRRFLQLSSIRPPRPPARRLMLRLSLRHLPLFRQPRMLRPLPLRRRHRHPARSYPPLLRRLRLLPCSTPIRLRFLHGRQMRSHTKHRPPNRPPRPCRMSIRPCWGILLHISHRPDRQLRLLLLKCRRRLWPLPLHPPNLPLPARRRACRRLPAPRPHLGSCRRMRDRAGRRVSPMPLLPWLCVVRPRYHRRPRQIEKMPVRPS